MQTFESFETVAAQSKPTALTIGTFDGIHLGHQAVLERLKETALAQNGNCAVIYLRKSPLKHP